MDEAGYPQDALESNKMGIQLCNQGRFEEAVGCFDRAIELCPKFANAYCNKGNALKEMGDVERARMLYEKAMSINPDYATPYHNLGVLFKEAGDLSRAIPLLKRAMRLSARSNAEGLRNRTGDKRNKYILMVIAFAIFVVYIFAVRR